MSSFIRLERKQTIPPIAFRICKFLLRSYSFGIETINTFIHPRSSIENHTRFQIKMGKVYSRFQTRKDKKNPTLLGGTYLYGLCRGVPLPRGGIHPADKLGLWVISSESQLYRFLFLPECRKAFFLLYNKFCINNARLLVLLSLFLSLCCSFCKKRTWKISSLPDIIFSVKYAPFCILFWFL